MSLFLRCELRTGDSLPRYSQHGERPADHLSPTEDEAEALVRLEQEQAQAGKGECEPEPPESDRIQTVEQGCPFRYCSEYGYNSEV